jgi:hypothetical protein
MLRAKWLVQARKNPKITTIHCRQRIFVSNHSHKRKLERTGPSLHIRGINMKILPSLKDKYLLYIYLSRGSERNLSLKMERLKMKKVHKPPFFNIHEDDGCLLNLIKIIRKAFASSAHNSILMNVMATAIPSGYVRAMPLYSCFKTHDLTSNV